MRGFKAGDKVVDTDDPDMGVGIYTGEVSAFGASIKFPDYHNWDIVYDEDELATVVSLEVWSSPLMKALR